MKIPLLSIVVFAALTASAADLSTGAAAFLIKIGLDPTSEQVRIAGEDDWIETTYRGDEVKHRLESLVVENKRNGVMAFVTTRAFIRKLKADYAGTSIPKTNYDALYLTKEERVLVGRKIADGISR